MKRWERMIALVSLLLGVVLVGAVCTETEAQQALGSGTQYLFSDQESVDYVLVLDRSGSMRDGKLEQAQDAAERMVTQLSRGDRAGVIAFDSRSRIYHRMSDDVESLQASIRRITLGDFTHYSESLRQSEELFNGNRKVIIFLSDGRPDDDPEELYDLVRGLVDQEVCMFTIAYAASAEEDAQEILKTIASISSERLGCGAYFRAQESDFELNNIFSTIYADVSSDALLRLDERVVVDDEVKLSVSVLSTLNGADLSSTCFSPEMTYTVARNGRVVFEETTHSLDASTSLEPGQYTYVIRARETCGGDCLFTGSAQGEFIVESSQVACLTPWSELGVLLTSRDYVEIHITSDGFSPQTVGTDGAVAWRNLDSKPHRVVATDGSFSSPVLSPGDVWRHVFAPGNYAYMDPLTDFSGALRNDNDESHKPVDLVLIMDRSGSMAGSPLVFAKNAAQNLISVLEPQDRASLVVFSDRARVAQPLTSDTRLLHSAVDSVLSEGSTFYIPPLRAAGEQFSRAGVRERVVIFLSDGAPFDDGGKKVILSALDESLGEACLYTIGYGEQGVEAVDLLSSMAQHSRTKNGCGAFYFSDADKTALSKVFGEIYAMTQNPGLELFDIEAPESAGGSFVITSRVRSRMNGVLVPSVSDFGCVPMAEVHAVFGDQRFPLEYLDGRYRGEISLPPGEYNGLLTARLSSSGDAIHASVGSIPIQVRVRGNNWLLWVLVVAGLLLVLKLFMARRRSGSRDTRAGF